MSTSTNVTPAKPAPFHDVPFWVRYRLTIDSKTVGLLYKDDHRKGPPIHGNSHIYSVEAQEEELHWRVQVTSITATLGTVLIRGSSFFKCQPNTTPLEPWSILLATTVYNDLGPYLALLSNYQGTTKFKLVQKDQIKKPNKSVKFSHWFRKTYSELLRSHSDAHQGTTKTLAHIENQHGPKKA